MHKARIERMRFPSVQKTEDRSMNKEMFRHLIALALWMLCALSIVFYARYGLQVAGVDFSRLHHAACEGPLYGVPDYVNLNPPHVHMALIPMCGLEPAPAFAGWLVASLAIFAGGTAWATRRRPLGPVSWALLGLSAATLSICISGQLTALMFPLVLVAWQADRRRQPLQAGIALGLLLAAKLFFGVILLWWLARGQWRSAAVAVLTTLICFAAGAAAYGSEALLGWFDSLESVSWHWHVGNASIWGPWARAFNPPPGSEPLLASARVQLLGTWVSAIAIAVATALALWRSPSLTDGWAICLVAALLLSPLGWIYYGWLLVPVLLSANIPRWAWRAGAACWLVPPIALAFVKDSALLATVGSSYTWGLLAVWWGVVHESSRQRLAADDPEAKGAR